MAKDIKLICRGDLPTFSINRITEAISKAVIGACLNSKKELILIESSEFGGPTSAAFLEGLVMEYSAQQMEVCPKCKHKLIYTEEGTADCRYCKTEYRFPNKDIQLSYVSEDGIADFVGRRIANGFANRTGDYYHLGDVRGRTLYYGTAPSKQFYTKHKGDNIALVLGSNIAEVPENWNGHVVPFCELFYLNEATGDIRIARNRLNDLLPGAKSTRQPAGKRKFNKYRLEWLMFIVNLLSAPYCPSDFHRGALRPEVARDWFVKHIHGAPESEKQYQRHLREFRHLGTIDGSPDKRERIIVLLLLFAAEGKHLQAERLAIAERVTKLVCFLKKGEQKNKGRPVEISRSMWQHTSDGQSERVATVDVDKFFDDIDERNAC